MSRSPTYCRVLIPPPGPEGGAARPRPSRGGGAARAGGTDASAARRSGTRRAGRGHTPLSHRRPSATGHRGCLLSLRGSDSCGRWGRGEPHPGEPGHRRLLCSGSPAPQSEVPVYTPRPGPFSFSPHGSERDTRPTVFPIPIPTWAPSPPPPGHRKPAHPPPRQEYSSPPPAEPRKFGSGSRASPTPGPGRPKCGLAQVYLAGASGPPRLTTRCSGLPPRRRPGGGGLGAAAAARGAEAAPRSGREKQGRGEEGEAAGRRRGGGGLTCATAMPAAAESLSRAETGSGAALRRELRGRGWERIAAGGASATPGSRRPGGSRGSGVWAPFPPRGTGPGPGAHRGRGVDAEASSPKQPRAARPNPAEEKPPPVSA